MEMIDAQLAKGEISAHAARVFSALGNQVRLGLRELGLRVLGSELARDFRTLRVEPLSVVRDRVFRANRRSVVSAAPVDLSDIRFWVRDNLSRLVLCKTRPGRGRG